MAAPVEYFEPQPARSELPARFASPFDPGPPHPLAQRAAALLQRRLAAPEQVRALNLDALQRPGAGKMFGVLVVADGEGRVGFLAAFSGMLDGRWEQPGFAPPLFSPAQRDAFWPEGEAELDALELRHRELTRGPRSSALQSRLVELEARHDTARAALDAAHGARRVGRHQARSAALDAEALHALAQESRGDAAERRRLRKAQALERAELDAAVRALDAERLALSHLRAERSRQLWQRLCEGYALRNARGERRTLLELFGGEAPPGGAGDCAAPKLLGQAFALGLRPLALAELWRGAPPLTGGRIDGVFYPACRRKCGAVLPFMLEGLDVEDAGLPGSAPGAAALEVIHEDRWLVALVKPVGLLSVPGRHARLADCVQRRLRARHPEAEGPMVAHRLDLDTSGILLAAKDLRTYAALQARFARREVEKRYVAVLEGDVAGESGAISLPLRVDLDDRPRQLVDPVHGRPALTTWQVQARDDGRTRVALQPHTGRTHQLRVHAAHALGLGCPIVGDRLYGRDGARLMLHAEALAFEHPHTGARVVLESPAPF